MKEIFDLAHAAIEGAFREYYESQGWVVEKVPEGYLIKKRKDASPEMCIHGGSTGTLIVIADGTKMIVGNVGDSSAILGGRKHVDAVPPPWDWTNSKSEVGDAPMDGGESFDDLISPSSLAPPQHLTIDHAPDDIREFNRM
jgi:hypothetical protein